MPKPGYPTQTYYPYAGWFFYRAGTTAALKASRAHFAASWGIFDPYLNSYPSVSIGHEGQMFLTVSMQM